MVTQMSLLYCSTNKSLVGLIYNNIITSGVFSEVVIKFILLLVYLIRI